MNIRELMVYLKTTETCQLNCSHCYTSGKNGRNIFFSPPDVVDWFKRLNDEFPKLESLKVEFHGGEPMLAPIHTLNSTWEGLKETFRPEVLDVSICTNLVYTITPEKFKFMKEACGSSIATSWDDGIRFTNENALNLWKKNVKLLVDEGFDITLMVSLSRNTIEKDPMELLEFAADLGVKYVSLERISHHGNAKGNPVIPDNVELDAWFLDMAKKSLESKSWEWAPKNILLNSILNKILNRGAAGVFCRNCEQKMITLNADGTVGGCPNDALDTAYGFINQPIKELLGSKGRASRIACEMFRNPKCYTCPVFSVCNGDCHQMHWQGDICASPKSMIKYLMENDSTDYWKFLD